MSLPSSGKLFNDPIHGSFVLHPLLVKIIDTPEFQRLRNIKQLGGKYYVFPGASHNRFEHCIGVCYLAGEMVEMLKRQLDREKKNSDIVPINEKDVLCVKIAGLCHDLGHGPFSHVFDDRFIPAVIGQNCEWKHHEERSEAMFDHMLKDKDLKKEFKKYGLHVKKDGEFIKDLIKGTPRAHYSYEKERTIQKKFLFEIVANKENGIDVDKWDYFARDSQSLGIPSNFGMGRTMQLVRVIKCEGNHKKCHQETTHICIRDNEVQNLYEMFHTRYCLHKRACQHKVALGVELMLSDALVTANEHLKFPGKDGDTTMSEVICDKDMDAYINLTDSVVDRILQTPSDELKESQEILRRLQKRQLYKCVVDEPCDQWNRVQSTKKIPCGKTLRKEFVGALPNAQLKPEDVHVLVVTFDYGMKKCDPIKKVLFYKKNDPHKAYKFSKKSPMLPRAFTEHHIRVYVKDKRNCRTATRCFRKWWKMQEFLSDKTEIKKKNSKEKSRNSSSRSSPRMRPEQQRRKAIPKQEQHRQERQRRRAK